MKKRQALSDLHSIEVCNERIAHYEKELSGKRKLGKDTKTVESLLAFWKKYKSKYHKNHG